MAAKFCKCKKSVILVAVAGGVVAFSAYAAYKYYRKHQEQREDDGSDDDVAEIIDEYPADDSERRVLVLGMSGAGKTSLLATMSKQDNNTEPKPTDGFNIVSINNGHTSLNVWEVGGADAVREHWSNFTYGTHILVFVVDSADKARFTQAGIALQSILKEVNLKHVPVVVVANKQDLPSATSPDAVLSALRLTDSTISQHKVKVIPTQAPLNAQPVGVDKLQELFNV